MPPKVRSRPSIEKKCSITITNVEEESSITIPNVEEDKDRLTLEKHGEDTSTSDKKEKKEKDQGSNKTSVKEKLSGMLNIQKGENGKQESKVIPVNAKKYENQTGTYYVVEDVSTNNKATNEEDELEKLKSKLEIPGMQEEKMKHNNVFDLSRLDRRALANLAKDFEERFESLKKAWKIFDANNSNSVASVEWCTTLAVLRIPVPKPGPMKFFGMLNCRDPDDFCLDFEEFMQLDSVLMEAQLEEQLRNSGRRPCEVLRDQRMHPFEALMIETLVEDPNAEDAMFRIKLLLNSAITVTRGCRGHELKLIENLGPPTVAEVLMRFSRCEPVLVSVIEVLKHWIPMMDHVEEGMHSPWVEIVRPAIVHCIAHQHGVNCRGLSLLNIVESCITILHDLCITDSSLCAAQHGQGIAESARQGAAGSGRGRAQQQCLKLLRQILEATKNLDDAESATEGETAIDTITTTVAQMIRMSGENPTEETKKKARSSDSSSIAGRNPGVSGILAKAASRWTKLLDEQEEQEKMMKDAENSLAGFEIPSEKEIQKTPVCDAFRLASVCGGYRVFDELLPMLRGQTGNPWIPKGSAMVKKRIQDLHNECIRVYKKLKATANSLAYDSNAVRERVEKSQEWSRLHVFSQLCILASQKDLPPELGGPAITEAAVPKKRIELTDDSYARMRRRSSLIPAPASGAARERSPAPGAARCTSPPAASELRSNPSSTRLASPESSMSRPDSPEGPVLSFSSGSSVASPLLSPPSSNCASPAESRAVSPSGPRKPVADLRAFRTRLVRHLDRGKIGSSVNVGEPGQAEAPGQASRKSSNGEIDPMVTNPASGQRLKLPTDAKERRSASPHPDPVNSRAASKEVPERELSRSPSFRSPSPHPGGNQKSPSSSSTTPFVPQPPAKGPLLSPPGGKPSSRRPSISAPQDTADVQPPSKGPQDAAKLLMPSYGGRSSRRPSNAGEAAEAAADASAAVVPQDGSKLLIPQDGSKLLLPSDGKKLRPVTPRQAPQNAESLDGKHNEKVELKSPPDDHMSRTRSKEKSSSSNRNRRIVTPQNSFGEGSLMESSTPLVPADDKLGAHSMQSPKHELQLPTQVKNSTPVTPRGFRGRQDDNEASSRRSSNELEPPRNVKQARPITPRVSDKWRVVHETAVDSTTSTNSGSQQCPNPAEMWPVGSNNSVTVSVNNQVTININNQVVPPYQIAVGDMAEYHAKNGETGDKVAPAQSSTDKIKPKNKRGAFGPGDAGTMPGDDEAAEHFPMRMKVDRYQQVASKDKKTPSNRPSSAQPPERPESAAGAYVSPNTTTSHCYGKQRSSDGRAVEGKMPGIYAGRGT